MEKKNIFKYLLYSLLTLLLLMFGVATYGQVTPNQHEVLSTLNEEELTNSIEAQALQDGYEIVAKDDKELGLFPSAPDRKEEPTSSIEAQALQDGYEIVAKDDKELGLFPSAPDRKEEPTSSSEAQARKMIMR